MSSPNSIIKSAFTDFVVGGVTIPVRYLRYEGHDEPYIIYSATDSAEVLRADDELENYITYYDFDIYSKSNHTPIQAAVIELLEENGFTWCPDRDSPDMYESDTGFYHKTLCFYIERSVN